MDITLNNLIKISKELEKNLHFKNKNTWCLNWTDQGFKREPYILTAKSQEKNRIENILADFLQSSLDSYCRPFWKKKMEMIKKQIKHKSRQHYYFGIIENYYKKVV